MEDPVLGNGLVKFKRIHANAQIPKPKSAWAAGADLHAVEAYTIYPGQTVGISIGLKVELPTRYLAILITPRSGMALNKQVTVGNSPGLIDPDYRGELVVMLHNESNVAFNVAVGDRVAQMQIVPNMLQMVQLVECAEGEELSDTERGEGGFGSTGK